MWVIQPSQKNITSVINLHSRLVVPSDSLDQPIARTVEPIEVRMADER
jgi:hypothetical protein